NIIHTWNIYVAGHGGKATAKNIISKKHLELSEQFSLTEAQLKLLPPGGDMYQVVQKTIVAQKKPLDHYTNLLSTVENLPETAPVPGTAQIAGIPFDDFARILKFLENDIYTAYFHYSTCFGGGQNQTFISDTLSQLEASFIVSAEGINEQ